MKCASDAAPAAGAASLSGDASALGTAGPSGPASAPGPTSAPGSAAASPAARNAVRCDFCAHECLIAPGGRGVCGVRANVEGKLVTLVYGRVVAEAIDPIEKKPLYHVLPGSRIYSIALAGCNFDCDFCQNFQIADRATAVRMPGTQLTPREVADRWKRSGTPAIAFTYGEPTVWQDYLFDCAELVRDAGGLTVMVSNGFYSPAAIERLVDAIDAFNIDLKGDSEFYRRLCAADAPPVIRAIGAIAPRRHVEVTTMVIQDFHSVTQLVETGRVLRDLGVSVWHLSRFFPARRMADRSPTSEEYLLEAYEAVRSLVPHVYLGNSRQSHYNRTLCPRCGAVCIERSGFARPRVLLHGGACPACGATIVGLFGS